ncbi:MAG: hypothetical protein NVS1B13_03210 [Flavisolibacter sp.]
MRIAFHKRYLIGLVLLIIFSGKPFCQDLTGIWRGYFISDFGEQYKYELQIEQSRASHINGVSYSYLDTRFYGKAVLTGNYHRNSQSAMIQEIKTVEIKMAVGSQACIMKCIFNYAKSGKEEFLEGVYTSTYEKINGSSSSLPAGGCGGGKVMLRRVATTDFYVEPFLRKKESPEANKQALSPKPKVPERKIVSSDQKKQENKKPIALPGGIARSKSSKKTRVHDTLETTRNTNPLVIEKPIMDPHINTPIITRSRQNQLVETINVGSRDINIRLYDNGEVDDDTISVYLDGKPLTMNRRLSTVPISLTIHLDDNDNEHTLIMYAENMGRIPPNTSLMIVQDGDKRYQVNITSTEQTNAMVRFRYQKKPG